jgi:hypothetical protein
MGDVVATVAWNTHRHLGETPTCCAACVWTALLSCHYDGVVAAAELYYGVSGSGAVLHTVNPRLFPAQIAYIINHAEVQDCLSVLSCALLCSPVLSCALLCSPVLSCALLCSPVLSCALLCPRYCCCCCAAAAVVVARTNSCSST